MRRRAFTMIEIVVSIALGLLVTAGLYSLMSVATRSFGTSRAKLSNLQAAVILVGRLEDDLRNLWQSPSRKIEVSKGELRFWALDREGSRFGTGSSDPQIALFEIAYRFDEGSNRVERKVGSEAWRLLPGTFESVAFQFVRPDFTDGAALKFHNYFNVRITCATGRELAQNREVDSFQDPDRVTKNVFTLIASVGADIKTRQNLYPVWNEVPWLSVE